MWPWVELKTSDDIWESVRYDSKVMFALALLSLVVSLLVSRTLVVHKWLAVVLFPSILSFTAWKLWRISERLRKDMQQRQPSPPADDASQG